MSLRPSTASPLDRLPQRADHHPWEGDSHTHDGDFESTQKWRYVQCGLLVCTGLLGIVLNAAVMAAILLSSRLRKTSSAFQLHQCLLDLIRSVYCIVFANSVLANREPPFCNLLGGSFIICATSSAFNLLAMVMSESYAFADLKSGLIDSGNCCCILFGIGTVWFASFILNLGVALLPGNPSYMEQIGHCTFRYGEMRNYVLHALWVFVVTAAMILTGMYLRRLHNDIASSGQLSDGELRLTVRRIAGADPNVESDLLNNVKQYAMSRMYSLLGLAAMFVLLWYPLFALTLVDANYRSRPVAYKGLTMLACLSSVADPLLLACLCRSRPPAAFAAATAPASSAIRETDSLNFATIEPCRSKRQQRPLIDGSSSLSMPQLPAPLPPPIIQRRSAAECIVKQHLTLQGCDSSKLNKEPPPQSSSWSPPESPILVGRMQTTL